MSRSAKYIRWQRISSKYQMRWKDIQRFPHLYATHNESYLKRDRRLWLWAWRKKKTAESIDMVINHVSWNHAPGTPRRFYTVKANGSRIYAWQMIVFANWQAFSKDVTMTGYWLRGYTNRAEIIPYPYDHSFSPEAYAILIQAVEHLPPMGYYPRYSDYSFKNPDQ